ncbi:hypothetical protein IAU60_006888 [Kwoniella sp. DSM 27419]
MKVKLCIDEIWVHHACTAWPQEDTIWQMFCVCQDGKEIALFVHKYEIGMHVKKHKNADGTEKPYTRVFTVEADIDPARAVTFSFLLCNLATGNQEIATEHMKPAIYAFNQSAVQHFGHPGQAHPHPALVLARIVSSNIRNFDLIGIARGLGAHVVGSYLTNQDAPVAYDRVEKPANYKWGGEERYARDYHGVHSRYGVAFKLIPCH